MPHSTARDTHWTALLQRRPLHPDVFSGVRTTGVVCRIGCSSRTPRRENVEFFESVRDATRAGYRPCKRCTPDTGAAAQRTATVIRCACEALQSVEPPDLQQLASSARLSLWHFHRLFKRHVGITPAQYARAVRSKTLRTALRKGASVTDAIYAAGFGSSSRGYEHARKAFAMAPSAVRSGGAGETLRYATARCALGWIVVAATPRGICAVEFADRRAALVPALQDMFPQAAFEEAASELKDAVSSVVRSIETPAAALDLPLDIRGTAFQQRVWRALQKIAAGTTLSYSDLAKRLGRPEAARAVAAACAANKIAVVIPCHRVVARDGALTGYRWGVERKRSLLAREQRERKRS